MTIENVINNNRQQRTASFKMVNMIKMVQKIKDHKQTNLQLLIFWENNKAPTKVCVSLSLSQWIVLCSATQVVDDLISRAKDRESWTGDISWEKTSTLLSKPPQLTIHIRKHFVPHGEWTLHPTKIGVTLSLYE